MYALRHLILAHRRLAALVCLAALAIRLLVPAGYMLSSGHGPVVMTICSGIASGSQVMDMPGMRSAKDRGQPKDHGKGAMPCAYSSLLAQALAAVDAILLFAAVVFSLRLELIQRSIALTAACRLRPPLRGPPVSS